MEEALHKKESEVLFQVVDIEDDPEYQLIVDCNALSVDIENENCYYSQLYSGQVSFEISGA